MLYLIGVGLSRGSIPVGSLEICKRCEVYFDDYTSYISDDYLAWLTKEVGKGIMSLGRKSMEEDVTTILEKAKERDVAVLVSGDPLVATTHKIIFIAAKKAGVTVKVCHAESILPTIMGESGLDFYRFGPICTIPKWSDNYRPLSFYETIQNNIDGNLHTIAFFDYDPKKNSSLEMPEAMKVLDAAEAEYVGGVMEDQNMIFVMHRLTWADAQKLYLSVRDARKLKLSYGPTAIIFPAKLSEVEREVVDSMY